MQPLQDWELGVTGAALIVVSGWGGSGMQMHKQLTECDYKCSGKMNNVLAAQKGQPSALKKRLS